MNRLLPTLLVAATLSVGAVRVATAEPPKIENIEELLHQAETASDPLPMLEKAKADLKGFKPAPGAAKMAARGQGLKARAGVDVAAGKHKEEAMHAIDEAIAAAKAVAAAPKDNNALGAATSVNPADDLKAKIESAAGKVHMAGELKH